MAVKVSKQGNTLQISVDGPLVGKIDQELVQGCIQAVLDCCNSSGCCDGRLAINDRCLEAVAKHHAASKCISSCFGCA